MVRFGLAAFLFFSDRGQVSSVMTSSVSATTFVLFPAPIQEHTPGDVTAIKRLVFPEERAGSVSSSAFVILGKKLEEFNMKDLKSFFLSEAPWIIHYSSLDDHKSALLMDLFRLGNSEPPSRESQGILKCDPSVILVM